MSYWVIAVLALLAGVGIGYLIFQDIEIGGKTAAELKQEHEEYRKEVQQHFTKTSDLFQSMTMQYRELYDHLSQGAQTLCETIPPNPALNLSDKALLPNKVSAEDAPQDDTDAAARADAEAESSSQADNMDDDVPVAGGDAQQDDDAMGADAGVAVNTEITAEADNESEQAAGTAKEKKSASG